MPIPVENPAGRMLGDGVESPGDQPSVVEFDLICRTCGYNLRGLPAHGRCPECDSPVDRSSRGDLLRFSDPRWVRTVARGMRLVNLAVVCGLIAVIILAFIGRNLGLPWMVAGVTLLIGVLMTMGVWMATEREPAAADLEPLLSARRMLRVVVVATIVLQAVSHPLTMVSFAGGSMARLAAVALIIVGFALAFRYAVGLAHRIPDPLLAAQTRGVMWGLIISYGLFFGITALALLNTPLPPGLALVFGLSCTVILACIMFSLWALGLIARYATRLTEAADEARLSWTIDHARSVTDVTG